MHLCGKVVLNADFSINVYGMNREHCLQWVPVAMYDAQNLIMFKHKNDSSAEIAVARKRVNNGLYPGKHLRFAYFQTIVVVDENTQVQGWSVGVGGLGGGGGVGVGGWFGVGGGGGGGGVGWGGVGVWGLGGWGALGPPGFKFITGNLDLARFTCCFICTNFAFTIESDYVFAYHLIIAHFNSYAKVMSLYVPRCGRVNGYYVYIIIGIGICVCSCIFANVSKRLYILYLAYRDMSI